MLASHWCANYCSGEVNETSEASHRARAGADGLGTARVGADGWGAGRRVGVDTGPAGRHRRARPSAGRWLDREQVGTLGQLAVAAGRAAESPAHPRGRVIARPADVLAARGQPLGPILGPHSGPGSPGGKARSRGSGSRGVRQSSVTGTPRTSQARRATRRWPSVVRCSRSRLQARGSFSTRMDHRSTRSHPQVVGDAAQVHVVRGDPAAQQPDHREHARIEAGEDEHAAARRLQLGHGRLELRRQHVHVGAAQDVVPARGQADQVRCQLDGARQLLGDDLAQQLARGWPGWRTGTRAAARTGRRLPGRPSPGTRRRDRGPRALR